MTNILSKNEIIHRVTFRVILGIPTEKKNSVSISITPGVRVLIKN